MTTANPSFHLTQEPDTVNWPETHYVFVERIGPFMQSAPKAWQDAHKLIPSVDEHSSITGYMSLYKVGPQIYRAGVSVAAPPANLPDGMSYEKFPGGKYIRFTLTGPYSNLPEASGRVRDIVAEKHIPCATASTSKTTSTIPAKRRKIS